MTNAVIDPVEVDRAYANLANAIVMLGVDDYRKVLRGKKISYKGKKGQIIETPARIEEFFLSDWFYTLTSVDGQTIINHLRREYRNECKANSTNS